MSERVRVAILASGDRESGGGGSTMARFIEGTQEDEVNAEVGLVICNNPPDKVGVYDKVKAANKRYGLHIDALTINGSTHPRGKNERGQTDQESAAICRALGEYGIKFVLTLGYMKIINGQLIEEWGWKPEYAQYNPVHRGIYLGRIINTHPGILPVTKDTHGLGASELAIKRGLPFTAHTLHMGSADVDGGPIIAENIVPIHPGMHAEELFGNVQDAEKGNLCRNLNDYFAGRDAFLADYSGPLPWAA